MVFYNFMRLNFLIEYYQKVNLNPELGKSTSLLF